MCIPHMKTEHRELNSMLFSFILWFTTSVYVFILSPSILIFDHFSISKCDLSNYLVSHFLNLFFNSRVLHPPCARPCYYHYVRTSLFLFHKLMFPDHFLFFQLTQSITAILTNLNSKTSHYNLFLEYMSLPFLLLSVVGWIMAPQRRPLSWSLNLWMVLQVT